MGVIVALSQYHWTIFIFNLLETAGSAATVFLLVLVLFRLGRVEDAVEELTEQQQGG